MVSWPEALSLGFLLLAGVGSWVAVSYTALRKQVEETTKNLDNLRLCNTRELAHINGSLEVVLQWQRLHEQKDAESFTRIDDSLKTVWKRLGEMEEK